MPLDEHEAWWPAGNDAEMVSAPERLPDPRRVDPVRAAGLRNLFTTAGWSGDGADMEIARALFCARIVGREVGYPCWHVAQDRDGSRRPIGPARHGVSTSVVSLPPYTRSLDAAARLISVVLPEAGYALDCRPGAFCEARISGAAASGSPCRARTAPLALLAALFDALSSNPEAAAPYREP